MHFWVCLRVVDLLLLPFVSFRLLLQWLKVRWISRSVELGHLVVQGSLLRRGVTSGVCTLVLVSPLIVRIVGSFATGAPSSRIWGELPGSPSLLVLLWQSGVSRACWSMLACVVDFGVSGGCQSVGARCLSIWVCNFSFWSATACMKSARCRSTSWLTLEPLLKAAVLCGAALDLIIWLRMWFTLGSDLCVCLN